MVMELLSSHPVYRITDLRGGGTAVGTHTRANERRIPCGLCFGLSGVRMIGVADAVGPLF